MKKYLVLFVLATACALPQIKKTDLHAPPKPKVTLAPEHIVLDDPLSQVQTMCLTEGTTSLTFTRQWVNKHMVGVCEDNNTSMRIYNNASGVGERDALRIVSANMLQCFGQVNNLPQEGMDVMDHIGKKIMEGKEIPTLGESLDAKSCISVEAQQAFIKGGMSCGFLLSLASDSTMMQALDVYKDVAIASEMVDPNDKEAMGGLLMQSSMCYKMVLDGIRKNMGLTPDDEPEETPPTRKTTDI